MHKALVLTCFLIAGASTVSARSQDFPISRGGQTYTVTVSYEVEKAYAGIHDLEFTVSVNTTDLKLLKIEPPEQTKIHFNLDPNSSELSVDAKLKSQVTVYKAFVDIPEDTEPRNYRVYLVFAYPNEANIEHTAEFVVGVRKAGKLNVVTDSNSTPQFHTGQLNPYQLEFVNNFPDFTVNIRSISVTSDPQGVIEPAIVPIENVSIDPYQHRTINLNLNAAPMSFTNLLSGFSDSNRLILHVRYDDSFGREVTDLTYQPKIKIRARDRILVIAMLVGVLIGAILKLYLQHLQQQGVLSPREVLKAVSITSLIGLVAAFIAVVSKIQIIAFEQTGSYDNPAVIFVISVAGAVGGAQLLSTLLMKLKVNTTTATAPMSATSATPTTVPNTSAAKAAS